MNRRDLLNLGLGLSFPLRTMAADTTNAPIDEATYHRLTSSLQLNYQPEFYPAGNNKDKTPGIHRMRIDNRILEISLSDKPPPPDEFSMPESLRTTGHAESIVRYIVKRMRRSDYFFKCFGVAWKYGLMQGAFAGPAVGGVGAAIGFDSNPRGYIKDETAFLPPGMSKEFGKQFLRKAVEVDYFKLDDFIIAVYGWPPQPFSLVTINGRRWVRIVNWKRADSYFRLPPKYEETFYTPIDRNRILKMTASLRYQSDYKIPDEMPGWMRQLSGNITSILRSVKLSPPDDGSEDPFLLDPTQKAEQPPIEFPAKPA